MARSLDDLLKALASTRTRDHHEPALTIPCDDSADQRMTRERAKAIPHRRLKRKGELVTRHPAVQLDEHLALATRVAKAVDLAATPRSTRERNGGDGHVHSVERLPDGNAEQLAARRPQPRQVDPRRLAPRRRPTPLAG